MIYFDASENDPPPPIAIIVTSAVQSFLPSQVFLWFQVEITVNPNHRVFIFLKRSKQHQQNTVSPGRNAVSKQAEANLGGQLMSLIGNVSWGWGAAGILGPNKPYLWAMHINGVSLEQCRSPGIQQTLVSQTVPVFEAEPRRISFFLPRSRLRCPLSNRKRALKPSIRGISLIVASSGRLHNARLAGKCHRSLSTVWFLFI